MKRMKNARRGFSLVELLAVVLILAVLAAVAVPLYINTRKSSAARACKANIAAIMSAESAYALRNGGYTQIAAAAETAYTTDPTTSGLVGAPEGLAKNLHCPVDNSSTYTTTYTAASKTLLVECPNKGAHSTALNGNTTATTDGSVTMAGPPSENAIP